MVRRFEVGKKYKCISSRSHMEGMTVTIIKIHNSINKVLKQQLTYRVDNTEEIIEEFWLTFEYWIALSMDCPKCGAKGVIPDMLGLCPECTWVLEGNGGSEEEVS